MTPPPGRIPPVFPNTGQAVLLVLGALFLQVGAGVIIALGAMIFTSDAKAGTALLLNPWTMTVINTVAIGAIISLGLRATRESATRFLAIAPFGATLLPAMLLAAVGLAVVLAELDNVLVEILQTLGWSGGISPDVLDLQAYPVSAFFLLVVVAPLTEEYMFRGLILRGLLTRHRPFVAIGLTALLFGLMHANIRQLFVGGIIGAVFGWWYLRTRSVGPCLIGHAVFNAIAWFAVLNPYEIAFIAQNAPGELINHLPGWFTTSGLLAAAAGLWWFKHIADGLPVVEPPAPPTEPPLMDCPVTPAAQPPASPAS